MVKHWGLLGRVGLFALLMALVVPVGVGWAVSDAEIEEKVDTMISQRHPSDTPAMWRGLGANAPQVIMGMADKETLIYRRIRLLQGLGWFDSPEVGEYLKRQALGTNEDVVRHVAIRSVANSQGMKEEEFLSKFLEHPDVQTRVATAEALKRLNDPRAQDLVARYLKEEKVPWVAAKLRGELPKPRGRLTPVASSEDRLSAEFNGEWRGFWISPKGPREPGMNSEAAVLKLKVEGAQGLGGEIALTTPGTLKLRMLRLADVRGKTTQVAGRLIETVSATPTPQPSGAPTAAPSSGPVEIEASIREQGGSWMLELRASKSGAILIARKNPVTAR